MNTKMMGRLAEDYAHQYLRASDYHILERNWFCGKDEIDIVANDLDDNKVVFVEVKALTSSRDPLDNFSASKETYLVRAGESYLEKNKITHEDFRFDVITMNIASDGSVSHFDHYQDVI